MVISIVYKSSDHSLEVFNDRHERVIRTTARVTRAPLFPEFLNMTYRYAGQRADESLSVFPFVGPTWDSGRDDPRDIFYLTHSASLVNQREGGILVMNVRLRTMRRISEMLADAEDPATMSVIGLDVPQPIAWPAHS